MEKSRFILLYLYGDHGVRQVIPELNVCIGIVVHAE